MLSCVRVIGLKCDAQTISNWTSVNQSLGYFKTESIRIFEEPLNGQGHLEVSIRDNWGKTLAISPD
jgi:hypothetical protein